MYPNDRYPKPVMAFKIAEQINNLPQIWNVDDDQVVVLFQGKFSNMFEGVDLILLNKLLKLIIDPNLSDYMTSKNNINI